MIVARRARLLTPLQITPTLCVVCLQPIAGVEAIMHGTVNHVCTFRRLDDLAWRGLHRDTDRHRRPTPLVVMQIPAEARR